MLREEHMQGVHEVAVPGIKEDVLPLDPLMVLQGVAGNQVNASQHSLGVL
jgi:hypothetical protein